MKIITKFKTNDGREFNSEVEAAKHEKLLANIERVMRPLTIPREIAERISNGEGWYQHKIEDVFAAREGILALARPLYAQSYPVFNTPGKEAHPLSFIGRVLSDNPDDPLGDAWNRFMRIDERGREHQQPYYAYTAGPAANHKQLN